MKFQLLIFSFFLILSTSCVSTSKKEFGRSPNASSTSSEVYRSEMSKRNEWMPLACKIKTEQDLISYNQTVTDPIHNYDRIYYRRYFSEIMPILDGLPMEYKPNTDNCFMTEAEYSALRLYVGGFYRYVNFALRNKEKENLIKYKLYIKLMLSALSKIEDYKGFVKRGVKLPSEVIDQHLQGSRVTYNYFLSTSIGNGYVKFNPVKYLIYSKSCKYIAPLAQHRDEEEVICLPGTKFLSKYFNKTSSEAAEIYLEEENQEFDIDKYIESI